MGVCVCDWPKCEMGKNTELIMLLTLYKKELPIEFLAKENGESIKTTLMRLKRFEQDGVITFKPNNKVIINPE